MKILFFTGSRAEYYLLRPLIKKFSILNDTQISLIVTGGILNESSGKTLKDINDDQIKIIAKIPLENNVLNHSNSIGMLCIKLLPIIQDFKPDLSIVYADRYESFGFAIAVSHSNVPLMHLEAGDITEGGTHDDQVRHCISKLSHLFCTSTLKGCEVLKRLGEEEWRCKHSGLISYEDMQKISEKDQEKLSKRFNFDQFSSIVLTTMHPISSNLELTKNETRELLEGIKLFSEVSNSFIIITSPNNDQGNEIIHEIIKKYINSIKNCQYIESLGGLNYQTILSYAYKKPVIVCGNSSSIIKEAPFFGAHSLNIGIRQKGREFASTQINCQAKRKQIYDQLIFLSSKKCHKGFNPYYKESPSSLIVDFIKNIFKTHNKETILHKKWSN